MSGGGPKKASPATRPPSSIGHRIPVIATKAGYTRQGPGRWTVLGDPGYLRQQCELSLRHLGLERIELYQLHRIDPAFPLADQLGELKSLQDEGKIGGIGLSEVSVRELDMASQIAKIISVQNLYNEAHRSADELLDVCTERSIGFIPWDPLATGRLARPGGSLDGFARDRGVSPSQVALAWLLHRSPVMLPIPGTSSVEHLEETIGAAAIRLTETELDALLDLG
jgi:pyridoxine 4-dehydrogenase